MTAAPEFRPDGLTEGVYTIPSAQYHSDPAPQVSLSRSGIVTLLTATPGKFRAKNPRLSPWPIKDESTDPQKLGSVVHALVLGAGQEFCVIDPSQYRNKDGTPAKTFANAEAKRAKQEAEASGLVVIDADTFAQAEEIQRAVEARLIARFGGWPIGESEQTMIWQRQTSYGPIWCRALVDHLSRRAVTLLDIKTTGRGLNDDTLKMAIANSGNDIQAAWYLSGYKTLDPEHADLAQFIFPFVEVEPPFDVRFIRAKPDWLARAEYRIEQAVDIFARCLYANEWPGYPAEDTELDAPAFLEARWLEAELESVEGEMGATA